MNLSTDSLSGISSSSALECGFAYAVSETFGFGIDRVEIAKLGQMSEHNFMNVNCGIMDQFIISTGKKNTAIVLDCNTLEIQRAQKPVRGGFEDSSGRRRENFCVV